MPRKLLSCVKKVKARGGPSAKYAWPICVKSTGLKPHKRRSKKK
jgi:hypothetical protein